MTHGVCSIIPIHKVDVLDGYRAIVRKTVAYVAVDQDACRQSHPERWTITKRRISGNKRQRYRVSIQLDSGFNT